MNKEISISINDEVYQQSVPIRMLLVDFIRDVADSPAPTLRVPTKECAAPAQSISMERPLSLASCLPCKPIIAP